MPDMSDQTAEGCLQEILDNNPNPTAADVMQALSAKGFSIEGGSSEEPDEMEDDPGDNPPMPTGTSLDNMADDAASKAFGG